MYVWLTKRIRRWRKNQDGGVAVEFALTLPWLTLLLIASFEIGNFLHDASLVREGLRAGVMMASRYDEVTNGSTEETSIFNLVKTGDIKTFNASTNPYLVDGWAGYSGTSANLSITTRTIVITKTVGGNDVDSDWPVYEISAEVPYAPYTTGFGSRFGTFMIRAEHEQAYIGK